MCIASIRSFWGRWGKGVEVFLLLAAVVAPTWVAVYFGLSADESASTVLDVSREQLFYQRADDLKGYYSYPTTTTDPTGATFVIAGNNVYPQGMPPRPLATLPQSPPSTQPQPSVTPAQTPVYAPPDSLAPQHSVAAPAIADKPRGFWHTAWPFVIGGALMSLLLSVLARRVFPGLK